MKLKKILPVKIALLLALVIPTSVQAEEVSIVGGSLNVTPAPITFNSVTLDLSANQTSVATSVLNVSDDRGSGAGWSVSLAITDFQSNAIANPSNVSETISVAIPKEQVDVTVNNIVTVAGQQANGTDGPVGDTKTLSGSPQSIINSSPGFGMGSYTADMNFTINIPKTVKVVTDSAGTYGVGADIGTMATTYTSTFTFTNTAGL